MSINALEANAYNKAHPINEADQTAAAKLVQTQLGLLIDGKFGPDTRAALMKWARNGSAETAPQSPPAPVTPLELAGQKAVAEAAALWKTAIVDPGKQSSEAYSRQMIDSFIRSDKGLGWSWQKPYQQDGDFQWCGAFVAACWAAAGLKLKPHRYTYFSSTHRLDLWGRGDDFESTDSDWTKGRMRILLNPQTKVADVRFPDGTLPRAGDILLVGDGEPVYGDHICLVEKYEAITGIFHTYEGNAYGKNPYGDRVQGVVKCKRIVGDAGYSPRRLIRPALADLNV